MLSRNSLFKRGSQAVLLCLGLFVFLGAGDESARFNELGHRLMCVCGCRLAAVVILVRAWKMRPAALPAGGVRTVSGAQLEHFRKQAQKETEI